jgi:hypothetical protein
MRRDLPGDMGVVSKTAIDCYEHGRTCVSVLIEGTSFGIVVVFEVTQSEPTSGGISILLELLSCTTSDTREPVQLDSEYRKMALSTVHNWVEENRAIPADYRDFDI